MNLDDYRSWAELGKVYKQVSWVVPQWLPNGYVTMLAADPGVGKSFLALSVCNMILSGGTFFDGYHIKQTQAFPRVLWIEAEAGEPFHMERAKAMGMNPLQIIEPRKSNEEHSTPSLNDSQDRLRISAIMAHDEIAIVVIDSLSAATTGVDENSTSAAEAVKWIAEQAKQHNKPVLLIHHMNKSTMRLRGKSQPTLADLRGSSAIAQFARVVWTLDNPDESQPDIIRLACAKSNIGIKPQPMYLAIKQGNIVSRESAIAYNPQVAWYHDRGE